MTIASPVALAGSLSLDCLRLIECDSLLLDLGVHWWRLTWHVVCVVQVPHPHLGRQIPGVSLVRAAESSVDAELRSKG